MLSYFHDFLQHIEALATASPELAFEKLNPVHAAALGVTLGCASALAGLLAYVALRVYRAGQWPPPGWRVVWEMRVRTGQQATVVAVFFLLLAIVVMVDAVWLLHLPGPVPAEPEVPLQEV
ncbi:MAG: hypothetical protein HOP18_25155 [Deltaproteobacteria bacterium]|nr:hypothetical protein [Deltaproteobacteria bacterium]